ncbi:hypothetical protein GCM10009628_20070 [Paeniglutamicibacter kerguelensis]
MNLRVAWHNHHASGMCDHRLIQERGNGQDGSLPKFGSTPSASGYVQWADLLAERAVEANQ